MNSRFQRNNFDLLRLIFAAIVLLQHCQILSLNPRLLPLGRYLSAQVAVQSFFVISGFLIFMSYDRSATLRDYFEKRFRRIYPAYFCVVVLCAIGGALLTTLPLDRYVSGGLFGYLAAGLAFLNFLQPSLPGVFTHNPVTAVNGALWTIKVEVMFYLLVPALAWLLRGKRRPAMLLLFYLSSLAWYTLLAVPHPELAKQLPGQLSFFMSGAFLYYYFARLERRPLVYFLAACVLYLTGIRVLEPLALGVIVIWLACFAWNPGHAAKHGDFSYGLYIYHFPAIQTLVWFGCFERSPWASVLLTVLISGCLAFLSWKLVEKPFLKKSSHYVKAAAPVPLARHSVA